MAGITSIGAYVPRYRLSIEEITRFWRTKNAGGEKAVTGYDEDSITMAVAAALDCLGRNAKEADGLYFATTSAPYKEKQGAAVIASAIDLKKESATADYTNSLRAGSIALRAAADAVKNSSAKNILVIASDCRPGAPQGKFEQLLGDGAAAISIGTKDTIADIEDSYSFFCDFADLWRKAGDDFIQSAEGRFAYAEGYLPAMQEVVSGLMKRCSATPKDFSKIVYYAADTKEHADLAKKLGFEKSKIQDPLYSRIGNTGTAASFIMLVAALEEAQPGDRILYACYGDGCDALAFRVTNNIKNLRTGFSLKDGLAKTTNIDYGKYLSWRDLLPVEISTLPQRPEPSVTTRWRERRGISALYGVRCKKCGTPQLHPLGQNVRICVACQAKDNFDPYKFSDKKGKLFSYAIDQLQPGKNPPGLNGVVDFDGGGRLICELTDCEPDKLRIDMPVEMTFRKMYQGHGIINYFWKAQPLAAHTAEEK
jgi:hydroxymethylglutaryl-CoA synthase